MRIRDAAALALAVTLVGACEIERRASDEDRPSRTERRIDEQLIPEAEGPQRDG